MKIVVDAFGGDNSPLGVIEGCVLAIKEYSDVEICLSGSEEILKQVAYKNCLDISKFEGGKSFSIFFLCHSYRLTSECFCHFAVVNLIREHGIGIPLLVKECLPLSYHSENRIVDNDLYYRYVEP